MFTGFEKFSSNFWKACFVVCTLLALDCSLARVALTRWNVIGNVTQGCRCIYVQEQRVRQLSHSCPLSAPLCRHSPVISVFHKPYLLLALPQETLVKRLLDTLHTANGILLQYEAKNCPKNISLRADHSSRAQLVGTFGFETGSLEWWQVILRSVGLSIDQISSREKHCFILATSVSSKNCFGNLTNEQETTKLAQQNDMSKLARSLANSGERTTSCAIVMNGGVTGAIYSPLLGSLIDAHPRVIRINRGIAGGDYTRYAGSKTSLRIASMTFEKLAKGEPLSWVGYEPEFLPGSFRTFVRKSLAPDIPKIQPSSGMNALFLGLLYCERVVIFGKITRDIAGLDSLKLPYHYFELQAREGQNHNWSHELWLLRLLEDIKCAQTVL